MAPKEKPSASADVVSKDDLPQWHALSVDQVLTELGLSPKVVQDGLTTADAVARLEKYGPNKLSEKEKVSLCMRIWKLVANVLVGILVFVAIISLIKGITAKTAEDRLTNFIEVGLIFFVVWYGFVSLEQSCFTHD